jgi:hypothetical protein
MIEKHVSSAFDRVSIRHSIRYNALRSKAQGAWLRGFSLVSGRYSKGVSLMVRSCFDHGVFRSSKTARTDANLPWGCRRKAAAA